MNIFITFVLMYCLVIANVSIIYCLAIYTIIMLFIDVAFLLYSRPTFIFYI